MCEKKAAIKSRYRLVCREWPLDHCTTIGVYRVDYDSEGKPCACSSEEVLLRAGDSTLLEVKIEEIKKAFELPLLFYEDLQHIDMAPDFENHEYSRKMPRLEGNLVLHLKALGWQAPPCFEEAEQND